MNIITVLSFYKNQVTTIYPSTHTYRHTYWRLMFHLIHGSVINILNAQGGGSLLTLPMFIEGQSTGNYQLIGSLLEPSKSQRFLMFSFL